ncbi:T9SS type A sorting domain-containing protein, partial [Candidatus Amoebophilus asiaticus]|nr:T9SS type A sorting domain-containing protein [Candidatus Amoebophilus asiaticus]
SSTGTIVGETNDKRIKGTSGVITTTRSISAPSSLNVGGIGAILTGADVLGSTTIQRSHVAQTGAGNTGIERFYDITPTNNTGLNMSLRFSYLDNELNGQTETSFALYRSTDGGSTWIDRGGTHAAASNYVELSSISAFSRWTVSNSSSNPLPIDLLSFTAESISYGIEIKWETATEINNDYFTIERSADGINFEEIRQVAGAGNSSSQIDYSIIDEAPLQGVSYYRLKQTDFDGRYEYFPAVSVKWGDVKEFSILSTGSNPVINELKIQYEIPESGVIKFTIIDLNGKLLYEENIFGSKGVNNYIYETSALSRGIYVLYLRVRDGDKILSFKFIK